MRIIGALIAAVMTLAAIAGASSDRGYSVLPNGWVLNAPAGGMRETDTMPQGAAASPDRTLLAVLDSGFNSPTLRLYGIPTLNQVAVIPLRGAFGRPVWIDAKHILIAGDNSDMLFEVDISSRVVQRVAMPAKSHPVEVARSAGGTVAVAFDGDGSLRYGPLDAVAHARPIHIGRHPGPIAFSADGQTIFVANRSGSDVAAVDASSRRTIRMQTGLHPSDVLVAGDELYVAASDADSVDVFDAKSRKQLADIFVGDSLGSTRLAGVSPNALAAQGPYVFASLGAANSVAVLYDEYVVGRIAAGWYPTDIVPIGSRLFVIDGKGERTRPNPQFQFQTKSNDYYVASIQYGSIRTYDISSLTAGGGSPQGAIGWQQRAADSVLRPYGPIKHVFFILKENRTYDQVLGDMREGDGDSKLTWFGAAVTPNQHALASRFGLFDNAFASGEVSDPGHDWADAAFANDFVERFWPPTYGNRRDDDDNDTGQGAATPRHGYIWDAAAAAHVTFRDYGELATDPQLNAAGEPIAPTLHGRYDAKYVGWNLDYSDVDREKEWNREFAALIHAGTLPQLEWIWLPGDHTYGSRAGKPTPAAYVATNDYAVGLIVDAISHSAVWRSSAVFIIEDDAQDGADHVSDQRTTLYVASPYTRGGLVHDHYSTMSVLHSIEIILGMPPLSTYDAMAVPMYDAFTNAPDLRSFNAVRPRIDTTAKNLATAFGAGVSARLDFSRPDVTPAGVLLAILTRNHEGRVVRTFGRSYVHTDPREYLEH